MGPGFKMPAGWLHSVFQPAQFVRWVRIVPLATNPFRLVEAGLRGPRTLRKEGEEDEDFTLSSQYNYVLKESCLGLFGLAELDAGRRTREIGMRKVLGARTANIVRLMLWKSSRPVLVANLFAWPVAWYFMRDWLDGFAYRIDLSIAYFLGAGVLTLLIAWVTVGMHAARVARTNPVRALRYE